MISLDRGTSGAFWSLSLFLSWLLCFPLNGPLLGGLAAWRGTDAALLGLSFTLSHGVGMALSGLWLKPHRWRSVSGWSLAACMLLSGLAYWSGPALQPLLMGGLGLAAALFFIAWTFPFVQVVNDNRVRFMAVTAFTANLMLYLVSVLALALPHGALYLGVTLLLPVSWWQLSRQAVPETSHPQPARVGFPLGLMSILCLVVFCLYITGGLLYNIIFPAFTVQRSTHLWFENTPYLATLVLIALVGNKQNRRLAPYLGVTLLGTGFVVFGLLKTSLLSYFLTESLVLAAFAVLDVFVWTLLADIGELHGYSFRVFGFGLAANVLALFAGGLAGTRLVGMGPEYPLFTGLLASGVVCATVTLLPVMHARAAEDLAERVQEIQRPSSREAAAAGLGSCFPRSHSLTHRELEIVALIVGGDSNAGIAKRLFISENTVKVHIKNINRKLGVANRYELLVTLMKSQQQASVPGNDD